MKTLQLEVGKTYRSRKGTDVRIIAQVLDSYQGDTGRYYAENGKWSGMESPYDLIEEAPKTSRTFDIPNGVKKVTVSQQGNRIVVEMVPEDKEPKPGDVCLNDSGSVYIFKSHKDNGRSHECFAWLGENGSLLTGGGCLPGCPATPEEAQPLWDALKKAGKKWNAETMQVEDVPESDRIREWVGANLEPDFYARGDVAKAIQAYLKYKEDKK